MKESKLRELIRHILQKEISGSSVAGNYEAPVKDDDEELEEITVTGDVDGYSSPFAFSKKDNKKKIKKGLKSYGYSMVKEDLDKKDIEEIKKLIRDVIRDVYRDIWLKRNSWK